MLVLSGWREFRSEICLWHHAEVRASPSHVGLALFTGSFQTLGSRRELNADIASHALIGPVMTKVDRGKEQTLPETMPSDHRPAALCMRTCLV
jgi:hypothetical protein